MVDAAYYRRQAATCRDLASDSVRTERGLLDLADHFERRAMELEKKRIAGKTGTAPRHSPTGDHQDA